MIPDAPTAVDAGDRIQEIDAGDLRRTSSQQAAAEAKAVGKLGEGPPPKVEKTKSGPPPPAVPVEGAAPTGQKKKDGCVIA